MILSSSKDLERHREAGGCGGEPDFQVIRLRLRCTPRKKASPRFASVRWMISLSQRLACRILGRQLRLFLKRADHDFGSWLRELRLG
jgi:hypothetical protein